MEAIPAFEREVWLMPPVSEVTVESVIPVVMEFVIHFL
jgi:hypothetical protein